MRAFTGDFMKILLVGYFYPFVGGASSRNKDLLQALAKKGVEASVLSPKTSSTWKAKWAELFDGIYILRFLAFSVRKIPFFGGIFTLVSAFFSCLLICFLREPDVIVLSLPAGEPPLGAFLASRLLKKPVIFDVQDEWEDFRIRSGSKFVRLWYIFMKEIYDAIYNRAIFCTAVTPAIVGHLKTRGVKRVYLLPIGLSISFFKPVDKVKSRVVLSLDPASFIVIYAGIFQGYYRIDVVIKAFHRLVVEKNVKDLKLLIVGGGRQMPIYWKMVKKLSLSDNVFFAGLKSRDDVANFLACSDIGVIPYDSNSLWLYPLPTKFSEYCASGLAIIASAPQESVLAEHITRWKLGLVVEPLKVEEMSNAIEYLYQHREETKQMGVNARELASMRFDIEKVASRFLKLLSRHLQDERVHNNNDA